MPNKTRPSLADKEGSAKRDRKALVLKAMAHPTRLKIIEELFQHERCVCELTNMVGADTSTISKHLSLLKNAGIVADEKRNQMVFYRLIMPCTIHFLLCLEGVLLERAKQELKAINEGN